MSAALATKVDSRLVVSLIANARYLRPSLGFDLLWRCRRMGTPGACFDDDIKLPFEIVEAVVRDVCVGCDCFAVFGEFA